MPRTGQKKRDTKSNPPEAVLLVTIMPLVGTLQRALKSGTMFLTISSESTSTI
jgi:hypothetical protein